MNHAGPEEVSAEPASAKVLKRKRRTMESQEMSPKGDTEMRDLFGDSEDEADMERPSLSQPPSTSRQRNAQLFGDSDDE